MSFFSRKKQTADTNSAASQPAEPAVAMPAASEEAAIPMPVPAASEEAAIPMPAPSEPASTADASLNAELSNPSAESSSASYTSELPPEFYGSYSDAVASTPAAVEPEPAPVTETKTPDFDFSVLDIQLPSDAAAPEEPSAAEDTAFSPMPSFSGDDDDDDLVMPAVPAPAPATEARKSMGYETTVKLKDARSAYGSQKPINEAIQSGARSAVPKTKNIVAVASGTAHVAGGLPELKEGQMYVVVTPKDYRRLKSRRFRGLGVVATLCLAIIAAFCIWSYANSFTDPLIGAWKGDMNAAYLPIDQIQQVDGQLIDSTWEFSSSGSLYLNVVVNETPISISGTYEEKKDSSDEPYLTMTLTNPMDATDYSFDMYYTITGKVLEMTDMEGMGMTIDLIKE